jgi:hypothetical protein
LDLAADPVRKIEIDQRGRTRLHGHAGKSAQHRPVGDRALAAPLISFSVWSLQVSLVMVELAG